MQTVGTRVAELLNVLMRGKGRLGAKIEQMLSQAKRPEMTRRFIGVPEMGGQAAVEKGLTHTLDQMHGAHKSLRNLGIGSLGAAGAAGVGGIAAADAAGKQMNKSKSKRSRKKKSSFGEFLKAALNEMGQPASAFEPGKFGDALREGTRGHTRQDRFEELSKWSLGKEAFDANALLRKLTEVLKESGKWGAGGAAVGAGIGALRDPQYGESRLQAILRSALRTGSMAAGFRGGSGLAGMAAPDSGVAQFLGGILGSQGLHGASRAVL
jgi:hypothetical protein